MGKISLDINELRKLKRHLKSQTLVKNLLRVGQDSRIVQVLGQSCCLIRVEERERSRGKIRELYNSRYHKQTAGAWALLAID
jgi:hypothetical protein